MLYLMHCAPASCHLVHCTSPAQGLSRHWYRRIPLLHQLGGMLLIPLVQLLSRKQQVQQIYQAVKRRSISWDPLTITATLNAVHGVPATINPLACRRSDPSSRTTAFNASCALLFCMPRPTGGSCAIQAQTRRLRYKRSVPNSIPLAPELLHCREEQQEQ